jgi:UTP:GlnB (protein PII) uridylyltransferase
LLSACRYQVRAQHRKAFGHVGPLERLLVEFDAPDEVGVLATIAGALSSVGSNIVAGSISSSHGRATDALVIDVAAPSLGAVKQLLGTDPA